MESVTQSVKQYLPASDFDQTLSFNDSGLLIQEWDRVRADWLTIDSNPFHSGLESERPDVQRLV